MMVRSVRRIEKEQVWTMRICRVLSIGLLLLTGCSSTSPFATTAQKPVPIATQMANHPQGLPSPTTSTQPPQFGGDSRQQFTQTAPNTYSQAVEKPVNPFFAGLRSTSETIGNAFTFEPQVIPASSPTSLANQPTNIGADLHLQAAQVYEGQQNIPGAISHFEKALVKSPGDPKILVAFGRLFDRQNDLRRAEGLYQQALQTDPNHCAALNAIGICYAKQGNLEGAMFHLSRAAQLQPQNARYTNNLANVLADAGRFEEAYAQLVAVHGEAGAHYNLGYLLFQQGKQDLARQELGLALQVNPRLTQARSLLQQLESNSVPTYPASTMSNNAAPTNAGPATLGRYSVSQPVNSPTINLSAATPYPASQASRTAPHGGPQPLPR